MQEGGYGMLVQGERIQPALVSGRTKQAGEAQSRWYWVEHTVWTDRMLTTLEKGVKGGVWFSLIDKVYTMKNLQASFAKVKSNAGSSGVDHVTIRKFEKKLTENLERLHTQLKEGTYQPQAIRCLGWI
jgi:RNA-directed DNA polymerase